MKLTPKQKAFADYYIELGNATESAIKAGYSKKTAKETGYENLTKPHIKAYIDERMQEIESSRIAKAEEVLEYLTRVVRDEEEEEVIVMQSIGDSMNEPVTVKKKLEAKDKIRAAELLAKRYYLFNDRDMKLREEKLELEKKKFENSIKEDESNAQKDDILIKMLEGLRNGI